jgi:hypothetical protein
MATLNHSGSVVIARSPEEVYDMVTDIARMGEWSPVCKACWWEEGAKLEVGAWFGGRNEQPGRTWETRSQVVAAEPAQEFAFAVGGVWARWGYTFKPVKGGTEVTESWEFLPDGIAMFKAHFGEGADSEIDDRSEAARTGIPATLDALKRSAEAAS